MHPPAAAPLEAFAVAVRTVQQSDVWRCKKIRGSSKLDPGPWTFASLPVFGMFCGDGQPDPTGHAQPDMRAMQKAALSVLKTGMTVMAVVDKVLPSSLIVTIQRVTGAAESHHALSNLRAVQLRGSILAKEVIDFDVKKPADLLNLMHEQYPVGQAVSAVLLSIDWRLHQLNLSFRTAQSDRAVGAALHGAIQTEAPSTMYRVPAR